MAFSIRLISIQRCAHVTLHNALRSRRNDVDFVGWISATQTIRVAEHFDGAEQVERPDGGTATIRTRRGLPATGRARPSPHVPLCLTCRRMATARIINRAWPQRGDCRIEIYYPHSTELQVDKSSHSV